MSLKEVPGKEIVILAVILIVILGASILLEVDPQGVLLRILIGVTSSVTLWWLLYRKKPDPSHTSPRQSLLRKENEERREKNEVEEQFTIKFLALGIPNHLKSEFIRRLTNPSGFFRTGHPLFTDKDWYFRNERCGDTNVRIGILDIFGLTLPFNANLYRGSSGVIFVFSKADRESFSQVEVFHQDFYSKGLSIPTYLVGFKKHKEDIEEAISTIEGQQQATRMNAKYYEVDVFADYQQIEEIFHEILSKVLKIRKNLKNKP